MSIKRISIFLALALVCIGVQAQSKHRTGKPKQRSAQVRKPRVPDNYKGTGAGVYDLGADFPEDAAAGKGVVAVSVDTIRNAASNETLIPTAEIDANYVLQAEAASPLDRVEVCDETGKVLLSTGLHRSKKASVDLNQFPKDKPLVFKFYGVNGNTQNIELSH